jgi:hypothetical protein
MDIAIAEEVQTQADDHESSVRNGVVLRKWLLSGEAPDGLAFRLFRSKYQEGEKAFQSPRHHHGFQQIRWAESGSINYAPDQDIPEGDIAYFPRGAYYGPQLKDKGVSLLLQYGFGPELSRGRDPLRRSREGRDRADTDSGRTVEIQSTGATVGSDVAERVAPEVVGATYEVPPEGYEAAILMHPQAFDYYEVGPGIEIKHLGGFYDHSGPNADVRISMIRLSDGGVYTLGGERAQLAWTTSPGLQIAERTYPELTTLYSPRDEETTIAGIDGVEIYLIEFPRLD